MHRDRTDRLHDLAFALHVSRSAMTHTSSFLQKLTEQDERRWYSGAKGKIWLSESSKFHMYMMLNSNLKPYILQNGKLNEEPLTVLCILPLMLLAGRKASPSKVTSLRLPNRSISRRCPSWTNLRRCTCWSNPRRCPRASLVIQIIPARSPVAANLSRLRPVRSDSQFLNLYCPSSQICDFW